MGYVILIKRPISHPKPEAIAFSYFAKWDSAKDHNLVLITIRVCGECCQGDPWFGLPDKLGGNRICGAQAASRHQTDYYETLDKSE